MASISCVSHTSSSGSKTIAFLGNAKTKDVDINTNKATEMIGAVARTGLMWRGITKITDRIGKTFDNKDANSTKVDLADGDNKTQLGLGDQANALEQARLDNALETLKLEQVVPEVTE